MRKTIKAKLDTSIEEEELLERQWNNWQNKLKGEEYKLYSGIEQQAEWTNLNAGNPVELRNDCFSVKERGGLWLAKLPHREVYGGIKLPIKIADRYKELLKEGDVKDSKLMPQEDDWYIHISVEFNVKDSELPPEVVIGVDLGERNVATSVALVNRRIENPEYHKERKARQTRSHYRWLETRLQKKGAYRKLKELSDREHRRIDDLCHKASREVVDKAKEFKEGGYRVAIAIGDLQGVRNQDKGRKFNKRNNEMPFYKLIQYIKYKAEEEGIYCEVVDESSTSVTCNRCGQRGIRNKQGEFRCTNPECEVSKYNADMNAAINIGFRLWDKLRRPLTQSRAEVTPPPTQLFGNKGQAIPA